MLGAEGVDERVVSFCRDKGLPVLPFSAQAMEDGSYVDEYCDFYDKI